MAVHDRTRLIDRLPTFFSLEYSFANPAWPGETTVPQCFFSDGIAKTRTDKRRWAPPGMQACFVVGDRVDCSRLFGLSVGCHYPPAVADVLGGPPNGTCRANDDHADRFARSFEKARAALMRVSALLQDGVTDAAEPLGSTTVWCRVCSHLKHVLAGIAPPASHRLLENHD